MFKKFTIILIAILFVWNICLTVKKNKEKFANQGNIEVDSLIIKDGNTDFNVLEVMKNFQQVQSTQGVEVLDLTTNFNTKVENALGDNFTAIKNLGDLAGQITG